MLKEFYKGVSSIVELFSNLLDNMGGIKGVLLTVGGLLLKNIIPHLKTGLSAVGASLGQIFGLAGNSKIKAIGTLSRQAH
jgi:hypothetical protein